MTFNEDFPELKEAVVSLYGGYDLAAPTIGKPEDGNEYVHINDIQNNCLSKKRVKEAIESFINRGITWAFDTEEMEILYNELGLEEK